MRDTTVADAIANAEHYIALGQTSIYLFSETDPDFPWSHAAHVEAGGTYRLNGPASVAIIANHPCGLSFRLSIDFEARNANGTGVSRFDREKLRTLAMKLPEGARKKFGIFLKTEVLPVLEQRTTELRVAMNAQLDSEDCVRGLIEFASEAHTQPTEV